MRIGLSRVAALALAALALGLQPGGALAAEEESKSKQQGTGAQTQATTRITVGQPAPTPPRPPTPEDLQKNMQAMAPLMGQMMAMAMENIARKLSEPQIAEYYAAFMRNYYLALVKQGFTEEQALKIVAATGLPSTGQRQ